MTLNVQNIIADIDAYISEHWLDGDPTDRTPDPPDGGFVIRQRPRATVRKLYSLEAAEAQVYDGPFSVGLRRVSPLRLSFGYDGKNEAAIAEIAGLHVVRDIQGWLRDLRHHCVDYVKPPSIVVDAIDQDGRYVDMHWQISARIAFGHENDPRVVSES